MKFVLPKRKSRLDIYVEILWSIKNGLQQKEDIIDTTGITGSTVNEMLDSLKSIGLILEVVKRNWDSKNMITLFDLTEKGKRVIEYLKYIDARARQRGKNGYGGNLRDKKPRARMT